MKTEPVRHLVFLLSLGRDFANKNQIKYIDRSALNKDLLVLKKAPGNKIPLNEWRDGELPHIIEGLSTQIS